MEKAIHGLYRLGEEVNRCSVVATHEVRIRSGHINTLSGSRSDTARLCEAWLWVREKVKSSFMRTRILDMTSAPPKDTLCLENVSSPPPYPCISEVLCRAQAVYNSVEGEPHYIHTLDSWLPELKGIM